MSEASPKEADLTTDTWPAQISLDDEVLPELVVFEQPLTLVRQGGSTLQITRGSSDTTRLAALAKTSHTLSFLPAFGERPFLIFPRPQLLCPAGLRLSVEVAIPLTLRLSIIAEDASYLLIEWPPPVISRGVYGPVDSAQICTSVRTPAAGSASRLASDHADHPILNLRLTMCDLEQKTVYFPCWARMNIKIQNTTQEPLEVNKIMIPTSSLSLYQAIDSAEMITNKVTMRLLGPQEADLIIGDGPSDREKWKVLTERKTPGERLPYVFLHAYKTKTGLEHGF